MSFQIHLAKEGFKFSAAHFTVFGADRAERLHGHNYYVTVDLELREISPAIGMALDFGEMKPLVLTLCARLDERTLVPEKSPYLKLEEKADALTVKFGPKTYQIPLDDIFRVPVTNITSEELARYFALELTSEVRKQAWSKSVLALRVSIEETRGQAVSFRASL